MSHTFLKQRLAAFFSMVLVCAGVHAGSMNANSGDADPSFGTNGVTIVDFTPLTGAPGASYQASTAVDPQGRIWAVASVAGASSSGLGLARLTRNGQLDASFGSGGRVFVAAPAMTGYDVIGLRIANDGKVYVAYSTGGGVNLLWHVCRVAANGSFDTAFFGGCAAASPPASAIAVDLLINPLNGHPWLLGSYADSGTNTRAPTIAQFDLTSNVVRTANFPVAYENVDPMAGAFNLPGSLFFTGSVYGTGANPNKNVILGYIGASGSDFAYQLLKDVAFDAGGNLEDVGRCLSVLPDGYLIGATVASDGFGQKWGTAKVRNDIGYPLDTTYAGGVGKQSVLIGDPEFRPNDYNAPLNACQVGSDGAFNLAGAFILNDPGVSPPTSQYASAVTLSRFMPDGSRDQTFGGGYVVPGIYYALPYAGTAFDYLRPLDQPRPRVDAATSISARVPNTGSLIVGANSKRTDGSGNYDLAVMRVFTDDIFHSGFEVGPE